MRHQPSHVSAGAYGQVGIACAVHKEKEVQVILELLEAVLLRLVGRN